MKTQDILIFGALGVAAGFVLAKPSAIGIGAAKGRLTYEKLIALPFETFGFREAEILRQFYKIKKAEPGVWDVYNRFGDKFQITYNHPHERDFKIIG
jgi:hypothetical protein